MTTEQKKTTVCDGVTFSDISEQRFKTGRLTAAMLLPLSEKTAAANAILPFLLRRSCREYPTFTRLNEKLSALYGAALHADVRKIGEAQMLSVSAEGLNDRYALQGESISKELAELLCSILFDPAFEQGQFRQEDVNQEKRQLIELIDSEFNDKRTYARLRCEELMCQNEPFGVNRFGSRETVEALTPSAVFDGWQRALCDARIELMMIGDSDPKKALEGFQNAFQKIVRGKTAACTTTVVPQASSVREYQDQMEVNQAKLVMGFRSPIAVGTGDVPAMRLMCSLFGGTPHSKLFLNVREKMSLCYYCSSSYDRHKGIMLVQSGVEQQNIEKARNEILNQLKTVQDGDFTESELSAAQMSTANAFRTMGDSLGGLESWYLGQALESKTQSPEQSAAEIQTVSKERVVKAAQSVSLDTVYQLTGEDA